MSLRLYFSCRTSALVEKLASKLSSKQSNPFDVDYIISQNEGVNKWLSIEVTEQNHVFLHIENDIGPK